jgi:Protein of unknown function with HXXEE motif
MAVNGHEFVLWLMLFAYGLHILEEHMIGWLHWARFTFKPPFTPADFYVTNSLVVVVGVCTAMVGWRLPGISLAFPALALINAVFFHIGPTVLQRRFSPGLITAVVLFAPVGGWAYVGAYFDGALTARAAVVSPLGGALLMAYPFVLFKIRTLLPSYDE